MKKTIEITNQKTARGRPKDPEKTERILQAAGQLFISNGLKGTSMDTVAKTANVSKQTLYSHFSGKDHLYRAVIAWKLNAYQLSEINLDFSGKLEEDLINFGQQVIEMKMDVESIGMLRSVLLEGQNYKKTSQLFYNSGPEKLVSELSRYFESKKIEDARFYAIAFLKILESDWWLKVMMGLQESPKQSEISAYVKKVCSRFIKMLPI